LSFDERVFGVTSVDGPVVDHLGAGLLTRTAAVHIPRIICHRRDFDDRDPGPEL
jgi:hypothetical protein